MSSQIVAVRCSVCPILLMADMCVHKEESSKITTQATGVTSWRRADVKYKKNEAFVDVVEVVNLSMSAKGSSPKEYTFLRLRMLLSHRHSFTG